MATPKTVEEAFKDWEGRRAGLIKGLTTEADDLYEQCDPEKWNLCLYGKPNEEWELNIPIVGLPPKLPVPTVGINFARGGSPKKNWLKLVAIHSDAWLLAVVFYLGLMNNFDKDEREELFDMINEFPTIYEIVLSHQAGNANEDTKPSEDKDEDKDENKEDDDIKDGEEDDCEDKDEDEEYVGDDEDEEEDDEYEGDLEDDENEGDVEDDENEGDLEDDENEGDLEDDENEGDLEDDDTDEEENGEDDEEEENANDIPCECCGRIDPSNEFWICCDICGIWHHAECGNPTPIIPQQILQYTCPSCGHKTAVDITKCKYQDLPLHQPEISCWKIFTKCLFD